MNQQAKLIRISELLSRCSAQVTILNANGEYGINTHAENVFIKVLNELYSLNLSNINYTKGKTYPAIDLGDAAERVAIQVTSSPHMAKILKTIYLFNGNQLYEQYDRLYIYIITQKLANYNQEKIDQAVDAKFAFTPAHIIDHRDIYKELNRQNDIDKIERVLYYLEKQFSDNITQPYAGLPDLPAANLPPAPYISLRPYTQNEASIFWGRGQQIKDIYEAVMDVAANPVILLYGQTGVGKSSLLDAGLVPRLKENACVYYKGRIADEGLVKTVHAAFGHVTDDFEIVVDDLINNEFEKRITVLIIDQVEEAWTKPIVDSMDEIDRFLTLIKQLLMVFVPGSLKVVLGYRKEYHAEIEQQCMRYNIACTPYFLEPVSRNGIKEVVNGCANGDRIKRQYGIQIETGLDEQIANDLGADMDSPVVPVLQILMTNLWEQVKSLPPRKRIFTHEAYQQLKKAGYALTDFLDAKLNDIAANYKTEVESGLVLDILYFFTTSLSTAASHSKKEVILRYDGDLPIEKLIYSCIDNYLLVESADTADNFSLAHDTLAPIVRSKFESSILPGQKANRILLAQQTDINHDDLHSLTDKDFAIMINGRNGMRKWTEREILLIGKSGQDTLKSEMQENILSDVSMEIHDNIGQYLSLIKLNVSFLEEDPNLPPKRIQHIKELISKVIDDIRDLTKMLTPSYLREIGLIEAIQKECRKIGFIDIQLRMDGEERLLTEKEELTLFRLFQETLNNILKHSQAKNVVIIITFTETALELMISDNGIGFDLKNLRNDGQGLKNMRYRMSLINGNLEIQSKPESGCKIIAHLPFKNRQLTDRPA